MRQIVLVAAVGQELEVVCTRLAVDVEMSWEGDGGAGHFRALQDQRGDLVVELLGEGVQTLSEIVTVDVSGHLAFDVYWRW